MSFLVDVIVLAKDNLADLRKTLVSCCSQEIPSHLRMHVSIVDSSHDHAAVICLAERIKPCLLDSAILVEHLYPPPGIYQSMNYALNRSISDGLIFMNSGDTFYDNASLNELAEALMSANKQEQQVACVFGKVELNAYNGRLRWISPLVPRDLVSTWLRFYHPCHQSVMFDTKWAKCNPYNILSGNTADAHVMRRAISAARTLGYINKPISCFFLDGVSSRPKPLRLIVSSFDCSSRNSYIDIVKYVLSPPFLPNLVPLWAFVRQVVMTPFIFIIHCASRKP